MTQPQKTMTAAELRQQVDQLIDPSMPKATPEQIAAVRKLWENLKPQTHASYWPVIDTRLRLLK